MLVWIIRSFLKFLNQIIDRKECSKISHCLKTDLNSVADDFSICYWLCMIDARKCAVFLMSFDCLYTQFDIRKLKYFYFLQELLVYNLLKHCLNRIHFWMASLLIQLSLSSERSYNCSSQQFILRHGYSPFHSGWKAVSFHQEPIFKILFC